LDVEPFGPKMLHVAFVLKKNWSWILKSAGCIGHSIPYLWLPESMRRTSFFVKHPNRTKIRACPFPEIIEDERPSYFLFWAATKDILRRSDSLHLKLLRRGA
jgi:hypothetical protein